MTGGRQPAPLSFTGAGGIRLAGEVRGTGPAVLLLHGGGQTRHSWHRTADQLAAAGRYAVTVDLRGHGDSAWSATGDYGPAALAADVRAVLSLFTGAPGLVGASLGGVSALLAAGASRVDGTPVARFLVLVDVTPRMEPTGMSRIRRFMSEAPDGFTSLDAAAEAIARYRPGRSQPASTAGLTRNLRLGADNRYRWHWDPRILDGLGEDPHLLHAALSQAAAAVRVPTLLVYGGRSDVVSPAGVRELQALIPHAETVEVPAASHMMTGMPNDPFSSAIVEFVSRH